MQLHLFSGDLQVCHRKKKLRNSDFNLSIRNCIQMNMCFLFKCKGASRLRQRRGQIAGLHNFGRTCFLNTLLQALAACPQFIAWLQLHGASDKKSLIGSLLSTLEGKNQSKIKNIIDFSGFYIT